MDKISHSSVQEEQERWGVFLDPLPITSEELALWEKHFKKKNIKTKYVVKETGEGTRIELQIYRRWWCARRH